MSALKEQIGGHHYKAMKIQPMEYSMANELNACQHTIIKYVSRYKDKGLIQIVRKQGKNEFYRVTTHGQQKTA